MVNYILTALVAFILFVCYYKQIMPAYRNTIEGIRPKRDRETDQDVGNRFGLAPSDRVVPASTIDRVSALLDQQRETTNRKVAIARLATRALHTQRR